MFVEKVPDKKYHCHSCGYEITMEVKVSRRDTCDSCMADLHCCKNCRFYDPGAHNECRESISTWVRDKDAANFCQSFEFRNSDPNLVDEAAAAKDKLKNLFSKLK